ncbi:MAG: redoxin domain-containing protein, partial [Desulfuromonadales bacterium]|nr:redoxin domain-containing protein [Desulfuromonadales bacterium]
RLPEAGGETVGTADYRGRRNLALLLTHPPGCAPCEAKLRELAAGYGELTAGVAEVLAVVPAPVAAAREMKERLGLPFPVLADPEHSLGEEGWLVVADRFGEVFASGRAGERHLIPSVGEIAEELAFIEVQCPE